MQMKKPSALLPPPLFTTVRYPASNPCLRANFRRHQVHFPQHRLIFRSSFAQRSNMASSDKSKCALGACGPNILKRKISRNPHAPFSREFSSPQSCKNRQSAFMLLLLGSTVRRCRCTLIKSHHKGREIFLRVQPRRILARPHLLPQFSQRAPDREFRPPNQMAGRKSGSRAAFQSFAQSFCVRALAKRSYLHG